MLVNLWLSNIILIKLYIYYNSNLTRKRLFFILKNDKSIHQVHAWLGGGLCCILGMGCCHYSNCYIYSLLFVGEFYHNVKNQVLYELF
jgi:hypothetical protein